jgi:hypothetical protein
MESTPPLPPTLGEAMATEPAWLRSWILVLVATHFAAVLFLVKRENGRWGVRPEPVAILLSFVFAGLLMNWLYTQVGYVRLLGLAHLVFWGPVWVWIASRRRAIGAATWFGRYLHAYLGVAGLSLLIDAVDVVRYLAGDGDLLHRWR